MPQPRKGARGKDGTSCPRLSVQRFRSAKSVPAPKRIRIADNAPEATLRHLSQNALHRQRGRIVAKEGFP